MRRFRRKRILSRPFPTEWEVILQHNARFSVALSEEMSLKLRRSIQILVAEKNWEGCGGLRINDEHRVSIAAQMARMVLHFPNEYFSDIQSVLIYPAAYIAASQDRLAGGVVIESNSGRLGEAWYRGPVVLSWADVLQSVRDPHAERNVVIHEFAHQLDMRNGSIADGFPVIESAETATRWSQILPESFAELGQLCQRGFPSVIDCYGASSLAEFFAVSSESYFEQSEKLQHQWPLVFELLDDFYRYKVASV